MAEGGPEFSAWMRACPYNNFHVRSYFSEKVLTEPKILLQFKPIIGMLFRFKISLKSQFNSIWAQNDVFCLTLEEIAGK